MTDMSKNIATALVEAQKAVRVVRKDSENAHHRYKYASSDDLAAECKKALNASGLALCRIGCTVQPATETAPANVVALYMLVHISGDSWKLDPVTVPAIPDKGRPLDKAVAGALTYSAGYTSLGLLQIERVDENDPDARRDDGEEPAPLSAKATQIIQAVKVATSKLEKDNVLASYEAAWDILTPADRLAIDAAIEARRAARKP